MADGPDKTELSTSSSSATDKPRTANSRTVKFSPSAGSSGGGRRPNKAPVQKAGAPGAVANIRKENLAQLIQKKKECEQKAHEIVLRLIEPEVRKDYLLENALRISQAHMEDVIEERKIAQICGWVLCDKTIDPKAVPKQTYIIRGHKVFDITERKSFCSGQCYAKSKHFKNQLLTSPLWLRDMDDETQFEVLEDHESTDLQGMSVAFSSVTLSDDSDSEEEEASKEDVILKKTAEIGTVNERDS